MAARPNHTPLKKESTDSENDGGGPNAPLPTIEGIAPSRARVRGGPWRNMLEFLENRFPAMNSATWIERMGKGKVVNENGIPLSAESPCRTGGFVFYYREPGQEPSIPFAEEILYQDDHILVADKPHCLPVTPSGRFLRETLLVRLKKQLKLEHLVPLHRIDRETAGLVVFSHNLASRGDYASLFRTRKVSKIYEALAPPLPGGRFPITYRSCLARGEPFFRMKEIDAVPNSETIIDVVKKVGPTVLYHLIPVTGRKHQLRLHLSSLGIPIKNDRLYPDIQPHKGDEFSSPLQLLAKSIAFRDPLTGRVRTFESRRQMQEVH